MGARSARWIRELRTDLARQPEGVAQGEALVKSLEKILTEIDDDLVELLNTRTAE